MGHARYNPYDHLYDTPRQLLRYPWFGSLFLAALATLSMGCMGSAVLPLAGAFANTGVIVGFATALLVAGMNVYSSKMLLRQASVTGAYDYESLGLLVGGRWWQLFVEISNWIILFGSIVGGIAQLGEAGTTALQMLWCNSEGKGDWLLGPQLPDGKYAGHVLTIFYVLVLIVPWSFLKSMKQLEFAGAVGYPVVLWMAFSIVARCIKQGFPSIRDGSLPVLGFTGMHRFAASVSTWGFAFYIQPIFMPYYAEMPPGNVGLHATSMAVICTLLGSALVPYLLIGFFGAALWGPAAVESGNGLLNDIFGTFGPDGKLQCPSLLQGALNVCMSVYLAITLPVMEFALRHIVNTWVSQLRKSFKLQHWIPKRDQGMGGYVRNVCVAMLNLTVATGIALACSTGKSAMVLTITGATGVLAVSFIIPIVNHFVLIGNRARVQKDWIATKTGTQLTAPSRSMEDPEAPDAKISVADTSHRSGYNKETLSFFEVGEDCDTVPAAAAWGSLSAGKHNGGSRVCDITGGGRDTAGSPPCLDMLGLGPELGVAVVNPESFTDDAPLINMFHAYKLADPLAYRKRSGALFWLLDVAVPVVVLLFGVLCSIFTLMTVGH